MCVSELRVFRYPEQHICILEACHANRFQALPTGQVAVTHTSVPRGLKNCRFLRRGPWYTTGLPRLPLEGLRMAGDNIGPTHAV
jgi:hypothetical protein